MLYKELETLVDDVRAKGWETADVSESRRQCFIKEKTATGKCSCLISLFQIPALIFASEPTVEWRSAFLRLIRAEVKINQRRENAAPGRFKGSPVLISCRGPRLRVMMELVHSPSWLHWTMSSH